MSVPEHTEINKQEARSQGDGGRQHLELSLLKCWGFIAPAEIGLKMWRCFFSNSVAFHSNSSVHKISSSCGLTDLLKGHEYFPPLIFYMQYQFYMDKIYNTDSQD